MILNIKNAEKKIDQLNQQGNDVFWENYTICSFRPAELAEQSVHGVFRNGAWGYVKRFEVGEDGLWRLYGFKKNK